MRLLKYFESFSKKETFFPFFLLSYVQCLDKTLLDLIFGLVKSSKIFSKCSELCCFTCKTQWENFVIIMSIVHLAIVQFAFYAVACALLHVFIGLQWYIFLGYGACLNKSATIWYTIRIIVPRNNGHKLQFFYNVPYPLGIVKYFKSKVFPHLWFKRGQCRF